MLHRIAWELRPASLDELGLTTALENYVVEWGHKHAIQADFHCSDPRLDKRSNEIRTTVYRVIQEGLTNVAKHAGNATNASVIIGVAENTLHLAIEDNGQGFDPSTSSTRLGLADDHPIILTGLGNLIEAESDLELVGQATSGQSALKMIREKLPDVAIVDISMPELNGIVLARRLTEECPSVRILILTLYEERSFLKQAMAAGVRGYMLKRSAAENLVHAIRAIRRGEVYVDSSFGNSLQDSVATRSERAPQATGSIGLTDREASVLKYLARGLTTKEIAARLELSGKTVETYKSRAAEKLNLRTRAEIVRFASAQGWLEEL
jgi:DNA-binding NarL/FixJ family response regulator